VADHRRSTRTRTRLRVGLVFGAFGAGLPIVGLPPDHGLASALGGAAHWTGEGLLITTGLYGLAQALRGSGREGAGHRAGQMRSWPAQRVRQDDSVGRPAPTQSSMPSRYLRTLA